MSSKPPIQTRVGTSSSTSGSAAGPKLGSTMSSNPPLPPNFGTRGRFAPIRGSGGPPNSHRGMQADNPPRTEFIDAPIPERSPWPRLPPPLHHPAAPLPLQAATSPSPSTSATPQVPSSSIDNAPRESLKRPASPSSNYLNRGKRVDRNRKYDPAAIARMLTNNEQTLQREAKEKEDKEIAAAQEADTWFQHPAVHGRDYPGGLFTKEFNRVRKAFMVTRRVNPYTTGLLSWSVQSDYKIKFGCDSQTPSLEFYEPIDTVEVDSPQQFTIWSEQMKSWTLGEAKEAHITNRASIAPGRVNVNTIKNAFKHLMMPDMDDNVAQLLISEFTENHQQHGLELFSFKLKFNPECPFPNYPATARTFKAVCDSKTSDVWVAFVRYKKFVKETADAYWHRLMKNAAKTIFPHYRDVL